MDYLTAVTAGSGLLMLRLLVVTLAHLVSIGDLPRNGAIGVRTRATKASDSAWRAGHLAALSLLLANGWAGLVMCVVPTLSVVVAEHLRPAAAFTTGVAASGFGYAVVVGLVIRAAVVADRAARTVDGGPSVA